VIEEVAKKHGSRISGTDALAFSHTLRAVREKKGQGATLNRIEKDLRATLTKDKWGSIQGRKLPALYNAIAKATRVIYHEGGTPEQALEAGLSILEMADYVTPYPVALPQAGQLNIPVSPERWSRANYDTAMEWLDNNQSEFRSPTERDEAYAKMGEIQLLIETKEAKAAARGAKKGTKGRDFKKFLGRFPESRADVSAN